MDIENIIKIFRVVAGEFESVDSDKLRIMIQLQGQRLSEKAFGKNYDLAVAYLVAHTLTLDNVLKNGGATSGALTSGAVTSEREGNVQVSYASPSNSGSLGSGDSLYSKTAYGQLFLELRKQSIIPAMTRFSKW